MLQLFKNLILPTYNNSIRFVIILSSWRSLITHFVVLQEVEQLLVSLDIDKASYRLGLSKVSLLLSFIMSIVSN